MALGNEPKKRPIVKVSVSDKKAIASMRQKQRLEELAVNPKPKERKLSCNYCATEKSENEFYADYTNNIGKMNVCKDCIKDLTYDEKGNFDIDKFLAVLKRLDKPMLHDKINSVAKTAHEIVGSYFRILALPDFRFLKYSDSDFGAYDPQKRVALLLPDTKFQVTDDLIRFWGKGYDIIDYENFKDKYDELSPSYPEKTAFHREKLKEYIRFQCKAERALSENNIASAKTWFEEARKSADAARINPKQMSQADLTGGLDTFSEFFREVEKADEIMDILPEFRFRPKDAVDFVIWCYVNYVRDIKGMPQVQYSDIYNFYDKAKQKFIEENGNHIFKDDPTEQNRKILEGWVSYYEEGSTEQQPEEEVM